MNWMAPADPPGASTGRAGRSRLAWASVVVIALSYGMVFWAYYPPIFAIHDEVAMVSNAVVWTHGTVSSDVAGYGALFDFKQIGEHWRCWRNPGRSVTVVPFYLAGGLGSVFWSGLAIHLGCIGAAVWLLVRLGIHPAWCAAVAFHPTLTLYSRTVMADGLAGGLLCVAICFLLGRRPVRDGRLAGLMLGLMVVARYQTAILVPACFLAILLGGAQTWRDRWRRCVAAGVSCGLIGALLIGYNLWVLDSWLGERRQGYFAISMFSEHIGFYTGSLMLLWPGLLVAPLFLKRQYALLLGLPCYAGLVMLCIYYFRDRRESFVENLVLGLRLSSILLVVWSVAWSAAASRLYGWWTRRWSSLWPHVALFGGVLVVLVGGTVVMFAAHQKHLRELQEVRRIVLEQVPEKATVLTNLHVWKLFGVAGDNPGDRAFVLSDWLGQPQDVLPVLEGVDECWLALHLRAPGEPLAAALARYGKDFELSMRETGRDDVAVVRMVRRGAS